MNTNQVPFFMWKRLKSQQQHFWVKINLVTWFWFTKVWQNHHGAPWNNKMEQSHCELNFLHRKQRLLWKRSRWLKQYHNHNSGVLTGKVSGQRGLSFISNHSFVLISPFLWPQESMQEMLAFLYIFSWCRHWLRRSEFGYVAGLFMFGGAVPTQ